MSKPPPPTSNTTPSLPCTNATTPQKILMLLVWFYILWNDLPLWISVNYNISVIDLFSKLHQTLAKIKTFSTKVTLNNCIFYKLKNLILFLQPEAMSKKDNTFLHHAKQKCKNMENKLSIEFTTIVCLSAYQFSPDHT